MIKYFNLIFIGFLVLWSNCTRVGGEGVPAITNYSQSLPLEEIILPDGFQIDIYAEVRDARSMTMSPSGVLYVGNKNSGRVYAIKDTDNDFRADKSWIVASRLNMPNGVAFKDGDLYVAEVNRILKFPDVEADLSNPPRAVVVNNQFPKESHHGWKYIAFGPDGKLYVPIGAPCNNCRKEGFASITRIDGEESVPEIFASGVRNTVGFTWHPKTNELWFTDNGRDHLGDHVPPCELNRAPEKGMHFGYPYCHGGNIQDPDFDQYDCSDFTPPVRKLGAHVAPLGLKFYTGDMFPSEYLNNLIIAEHGSWNRSKKNGYRLSLVTIENNTDAVSYSVFARGWLDEKEQEAWGRPVDLLVLNDGSLLVSDDKAGVIYRISYIGA
jgi:glucose/arabinose dehydrogenase